MEPEQNLLVGDCLEVMKGFDANSIDAVVTDPPYGLIFMNKKWDAQVPSKEIWSEVLRVLKPGAYLLAFGGTRTYHHLAMNIELAGFEIRDQIQWIYGSGFPKSLDISKAIDKAAGAERENGELKFKAGTQLGVINDDSWKPKDVYETAPSTDLAKQWQGFGTALKPANEPIVLARKPLSEKTVAANVLKWGTGGLNIDACRVALAATENVEKLNARSGGKRGFSSEYVAGQNNGALPPGCDLSQGRFPANLIFDEEAARMLDEQSGKVRSSGNYQQTRIPNSAYFGNSKSINNAMYSDSGGASRFFYVAKASKRERGEGNVHPTVKPIKLMEYLCKLITPPGGVILDPFMGSGTTGIASKNLGFEFIGIEKEKDYVTIAESRLSGVS